MLAAVEIPQHHVPARGDEAGAGGIVCRPQLHIGGVGGVANVQWVEEEDAAQAATNELIADALQAIRAHGGEMRRLQTQTLPLGERQRSRSGFCAVVVVD